jgi:hypothetical protein
MNFNTLSYLIVTVASLAFCGAVLYFTHDQGTHDFAIAIASLVVGHWFGYSNQITNVGHAPGATARTQEEPPKTT